MKKTYKIKALIPAWKLGFFGREPLVAVPDKFEGKELWVQYVGEKMLIKKVGENAVSHRSFADKFGRIREYTLIYHIWQPGNYQEHLF